MKYPEKKWCVQQELQEAICKSNWKKNKLRNVHEDEKRSRVHKTWNAIAFMLAQHPENVNVDDVIKQVMCMLQNSKPVYSDYKNIAARCNTA